ncbi:fibroblast growth factor 1-like [Harmonia axyridis]|uniref:fibroblast growth factor 1-like n=1 Tax=Harmonia axyridis TaxID=115357 RepID=UPI001E274ED2|nr:fibroblast growth factor 1-like [Harmonia axyridis]XP_045476799.1 fibroblast growth factor 1-like [Harmonia axyridis]
MSSESYGYGQKMRLFSETGYHLTIRNGGRVEGSQEEEDPECFLELVSAGPGLVQIKGMESNLCLCFDDEGQLYGESEHSHDGSVFHETLEGLYNAYKSVKYPDWFVGIKKNGKPKPGPKTGYGQKAVRFLPRRLHF